jgi:hypothetical protein
MKKRHHADIDILTRNLDSDFANFVAKNRINLTIENLYATIENWIQTDNWLKNFIKIYQSCSSDFNIAKQFLKVSLINSITYLIADILNDDECHTNSEVVENIVDMILNNLPQPDVSYLSDRTVYGETASSEILNENSVLKNHSTPDSIILSDFDEQYQILGDIIKPKLEQLAQISPDLSAVSLDFIVSIFNNRTKQLQKQQNEDLDKLERKALIRQINARTLQEIEIAKRIGTAADIEYEEEYETGGEGNLGIKSGQQNTSIGISGKGNKMTKRKWKLKGNIKN